MSITRRQFLLTTSGAGLGIILPSFYEKALAFYQNHGEPLILPSKDSNEILYASTNSINGIELFLGNPEVEIPKYTWREFIKEFKYGDSSDYIDPEDEEGEALWIDLDAKADPAEVADYWYYPWTAAYDYLTELDLGPDLDSPDAVGELRLLSGFPGSDYRGIAAADYITLSLLQERLNQLNEGIRIELL